MRRPLATANCSPVEPHVSSADYSSRSDRSHVRSVVVCEPMRSVIEAGRRRRMPSSLRQGCTADCFRGRMLCHWHCLGGFLVAADWRAGGLVVGGKWMWMRMENGGLYKCRLASCLWELSFLVRESDYLQKLYHHSSQANISISQADLSQRTIKPSSQSQSHTNIKPHHHQRPCPTSPPTPCNARPPPRVQRSQSAAPALQQQRLATAKASSNAEAATTKAKGHSCNADGTATLGCSMTFR